MTKVQINVDIDVHNDDHVDALNVFLRAVGAKQSTDRPAAIKAREKKASEAFQKAIEPKADESSQLVPTVANEDDLKQEAREKLAEYLQANPDSDENKKKAKAKFKDLGAKGMSTLDPDKLPDLIKWLNEQL